MIMRWSQGVSLQWLFWVFILYTLLPGELWARTPKLLFIPIENKSTAAYSYVKKTVTENLRAKLRARFDFTEVAQHEIEDTAEENHFVYADEFYTKSVALQLGILLQSDIALSGSYRAEYVGGRQTLVFQLFLHSVQNRELVSVINFETPADGTIFRRLEVLSEQVMVQAAKVLPNKGEKGRSYTFLQNFRSTLLLSAGTNLAVAPQERTTIESGDLAFNPADFALIPLFQIGYRRHKVWSDYDWVVDLGISVGSSEKSLLAPDNKTDVSLTGLAITTGPGYKYMFLPELYVYAQAGVGYYFGTATIDTGLPGKIVTDDESGNTLTEQPVDFFAPVLQLSTRVGTPITGPLAAELGLAYRLYFGDGTSHELLFSGGISFGI